MMNTNEDIEEKASSKKDTSLVAGFIGAIAAFICASVPTLFWFTGGLSGEHAFAILLPIVVGIVLLVLAVGYALVNGAIWAVQFGKKSWRAVPWMALSLGGAFLIPILPVLVLFWASDWRSCLNATLVLGALIGFVVLVNALLRKYDKSLVLSAFTFTFLLAGIILAASGFALSVGDTSNRSILMVVGGIGMGIVGLGFGVAAFIVYVVSSPGSTGAVPSGSYGDPEITTGSDLRLADVSESGVVSSERGPDSRTVASILGAGSCLLGIGFIGALAFIIAAIVFILWLFRDFSMTLF
jgi:hypothetical protein